MQIYTQIKKTKQVHQHIKHQYTKHQKTINIKTQSSTSIHKVPTPKVLANNSKNKQSSVRHQSYT